MAVSGIRSKLIQESSQVAKSDPKDVNLNKLVEVQKKIHKVMNELEGSPESKDRRDLFSLKCQVYRIKKMIISKASRELNELKQNPDNIALSKLHTTLHNLPIEKEFNPQNMEIKKLIKGVREEFERAEATDASSENEKV